MKILPPLQEEDSMIAALSYPFWYIISWLILLSHKKDDPFVKFHALQSLVLGVLTALVSFLLTLLLYGIFRLVPFMGRTSAGKLPSGEAWYLMKGLFFVVLFALFCFILMIISIIIFYYAYRAYKGEYFTIPGIGKVIEEKYFSFLEDAVEEEAEPVMAEDGPRVTRIIEKLGNLPFNRDIK